MGGVLVSWSDGVPGKKIVDVLGEVSVERWAFFDSGKEAMLRRLKLEAELIGANAIVNLVYKPVGFSRTTVCCSGLGVKVN